MYAMNTSLSCGHDQARFIEESGDGLPLRNVDCGACRTIIVGTHFRCTICNFRLHPICKPLRRTLSTPLHPHRLLNLVAAAAAAAPTRRCDVCSDPVRGVYYKCCEFDLHPGCSEIPPRVHHVLDLRHALELRHAPASSRRRCDVCREECSGWAYRCVDCNLDVHYRCLLRPAGVDQPPPPPPTTTRGVRQPFYFGQPNYYYYNGYGGGNGGLPYWLQGNPAGGVGFGPDLGIGPGLGLGNIVGSLAVNLLTSLFSNLIQNEFFAV